MMKLCNNYASVVKYEFAIKFNLETVNKVADGEA